MCVCDEVVHFRVRKYTETPDLNVVEARDFDIFIVVIFLLQFLMFDSCLVPKCFTGKIQISQTTT